MSNKVAAIGRDGRFMVNAQHTTPSTTQYARSYISEGAAVTDSLDLYLDADDWGSYPGTKTLTGKFTEYSSGSSHYRTMGRNGVVLLGTSTSWIGYFSADPSSTGRHTLMFDYWSDVAQSNSLVLDNDGIHDNEYNATLSTQTYRQTRFENFTHTTTGNIKFYFRNNAAGNKVYVDNVRFFKADDTWNDLSGNGNDGTISGATPAIDSAAGLCFDLDGTNDYIYMPQFDFTSTHSLEWWFNTDNLTEKYSGGYAGHMLAWGYAPSERIQLRTNGGIRIYIHDGSSGDNFDTSNFSVTAGNWTHIVVTFDWDAESVKCYQNGVLKDTIDISSLGSWNYTGASNSYDYIDFGRNVSNNNIFFDGKVANIKIYTELLTAAQVKQNFNSERNRFGV